jgi:choline dehydrogenase-like flavoprotein
MIENLNNIGDAHSLAVDICIIGSGAAGITIAREFLSTSHRVIMLEAGGEAIEQKYQDPYKSEIVGLKHNGIHIGRVRALGGTTTLWAGQCLPLFDIDFQKRDWVEHSGWPISRADLAPYYPRAQAVMRLAPVTHDVATWPKSAAKPPEYAGDDITTYYSLFSPMPNFARAYASTIAAAKNIQVLTNANVVTIIASPDASSVTQVDARSVEGKRLTIRAHYFLICCGGIETARLLLASRSVEPNGIGNSRDVVGRYFQDHPGVIFPVRPRNRRRFSQLYDSFREANIRHCIKLAATESLQRSECILHVGGEVFYPAQDHDPIDAAKLVVSAIRNPQLRADVPRSLLRIAQRPDRVIRAVYRRYVKHQVASVGSSKPFLGLSVEQQPNSASRVMLSESRDSLGMPRTVLEWKPTELEARSISVFAHTVAREWKRLGLADLDPDSVPILGREKGLHGGYTDASHHIGTTRMGTDRATSVVDPHCRVHGYSNLYIAGSSVFPTGGFSNPTLTLMALALRSADEIKASLATSAAQPAVAYEGRKAHANPPRIGSAVAEPATA